MARITELQNQILGLRKQQTTLALEIANTTDVGSQGDDVKLLQLFLAQDSSLYPDGLMTGYFGKKTEKALQKFAEKYNDDNDNDKGKKNGKKEKHRNENSLNNINKALKGGSWIVVKSATDPNTCIVTPPGHFIARGHIKNFGKPVSVPCKDLPPGIQKLLDGTITPPGLDTTAPTFGTVTVGNLSSTGATISVTTSERTYTRAEYGTPTAYGTTTSFGTFGTSTTVTLTGLTPSTTYNFVLRAKDGAGNVGTSTNMTFTTTATPDTTAPVISGVTATSAASTTASIAWTTNEAATSKVYYGTTTPLSLASALSASDATLLTSHTMAIGSLTASTTYRFVVESKDAANNTATTTESSFVTMP